MDPLKYIMGTDEASKLWGFSPDHIKRMCRDGKVKAKRIGKTWVIDKTQPNPKKSKEESEMNVPNSLIDQNVTIESKWIEENLPHVHDNILDHARMYARDEHDSFTEEQYESWKNDGYLVQFIFGEDHMDITPYSVDDEPAHDAWWLDRYSNWPADDLQLLFEKAKEELK